ncbi:HalOD1 output domain-containing protein [Halobaculum magnesiiphilum]|uniref:Halobacterial output domain-containing protein n=1 Tax=Halobaculum magnesiiphilum TaxID=1017351 RepID=A0A8T8WFA5_9EURY|nr:HalOD1 output domain-containing protein [Halobaculum magnesiiphilum]QZP38537.1 hypothetical protein K6T50_05190 [Halobaculum magnesiiphilum]
MSSLVVDRVVAAIADAEGKDPLDLDYALQDYIDADAIHQLAAHDGSSWTLQFEVPNHTVTVTGEGAVLVDGTKERVPSDD